MGIIEQNGYPGKEISVAIADDHQLLRDLLIENINLSKKFRVVLSADNGIQLLEALKQIKALPDICILDINMPEMNGYDTQIAIKKHWPEMKTLALSIYDEEDCVVQMLKNGANGFVSKSSPKENLFDALLSVYEHGSYHPEIMEERSFKQSSGLPFLTKREKEYLTLTCAELKMDDIAIKLGIHLRTVEHYRDNVYKKLCVNNKADLIFYVKRTGLVFIK